MSFSSLEKGNLSITYLPLGWLILLLHPVVEQLLVDPTEFQVGERSDQTGPSQSNKILPGQRLTGLVHVDGEIDEVCGIDLPQTDIREEALSNSHERLMRPLLEPINRAGLDEGGKVLQPPAEVLVIRGHAENNMQLLPNDSHEVVVKCQRRSIGLHILVVIFVDFAHFLDNVILILALEQVGDLPREQKVMDVFQKVIVFDLKGD